MNLTTRKIIAREFLLLIVVALIGILFFAGTYFNNFFFEKKKNSLENEMTVTNKIRDSLKQTLSTPDIISYSSKAVPVIRFEKDFCYINKSNEINLFELLKQLRKSSKSEDEQHAFFISFRNRYSLKLDTLFISRDGQQATKSQLLSSGYSESRIFKGVKNGIISVLGGLPQRYITVMFPDGTTTVINETQSLNAVAKGAKYIDGPDEIVKIPITLDEYVRNKEKSDSLDNLVNELVYKYNNSKSKILSFEDRINFLVTVLLISSAIIFLLRYLFYGILCSLKTLKFRE